MIKLRHNLTIKTSIKAKLAKLEISGKNIKSFDYAHDVIHLDEVKQKIMDCKNIYFL